MPIATALQEAATTVFAGVTLLAALFVGALAPPAVDPSVPGSGSSRRDPHGGARHDPAGDGRRPLRSWVTITPAGAEALDAEPAALRALLSGIGQSGR